MEDGDSVPYLTVTSGVFPHIGRQQKVEGVRKLVTRRYPYLVYYKIDKEAEQIVILAIQHPAREREHSDT